MSILVKPEIIARARRAAENMQASHGFSTSPYFLMEVLELNSRIITDEDEIKGIRTIIALGGAEHFDSGNNQMICYDKYIIGDYLYTISSFSHGPDVVHETLIITEEDFLS